MDISRNLENKESNNSINELKKLLIYSMKCKKRRKKYEIFKESLDERNENNKGLFIDSKIMLKEEKNPEYYFHFYLKLLNYYFNINNSC